MNGLPFPQIDPIAFSIGGFNIHWYGLAYLVGFFFAAHYLSVQTQRYPSPFTKEHVENLFSWGILGVILGGRLGYTLFYNPAHYLSHPVEILYLWQGGMSYHGGLLGVIGAILIFAKNKGFSPFEIGDRLAPGACIGLLLGRITNFINGELYGRITEVPWGVIFPHGGPFARHPSQLYEAFLEGIVLFIVLHTILIKRHRLGEASGIFLTGYGLARILVETVRQPDNLAHLQEGIFTTITMGQLLSVPMLIAGVWMLVWSRSNQINLPQNKKA